MIQKIKSLCKFFKWKAGISSELEFWDKYFKTKGLQWPQAYQDKLNLSLPLQANLVKLLPDREEIHILDVGAGPLTALGKTCDGRKIHITAVDPLAKQYAQILLKYGIVPPVKTEPLEGEKLKRKFAPMTFDLAYARNCLDHAYNPENAIDQMILVVKDGCYVVLIHHVNEADTRNFRGLHQWNFSFSDEKDFLIRSRNREINITKKYSGLHSVVSYYNPKSKWLTTTIQKNRS